MRKLLSCIVLSLSLIGVSAFADTSKIYIGGGFSDGSVDIGDDDSRSLGTLTATIGFQYNDYIGLELGFGAASDESGSILNDPLVTYQAAMIRLGYRWDRAAVYVLGGTAALDIDESFNDSESGNAIGFGINLFGNENTSLNFHVIEFDDGAFSSATIGFQYYFGGFR